MKPLPGLRAPAGARTLTSAIRGHAVLRASADALKSLRQSPGTSVGEPLPANFLKHADDQTVTAVAAVLRAVHDFGLAQTDFSRWGVLAAPRRLARGAVALALKRFNAEGAWGVSPHLIPNRSLHAVSGTISQALQIHGPNFGVGGGPGSAAKSLLAASTLLECERLPGLWLVLTGWNWEPGIEIPQAIIQQAPHLTSHGEPAVCTAVAMALLPDSDRHWGARWHVAAGDVRTPATGQRLLTLEAVAEALETSAHGSWCLPCGGAAEFHPSTAAVEKCA